MSQLFWYKRKEMVEEKVEGTGESPSQTIKKEVVFWDCFNLKCVVRGLWGPTGTFSVLLNDGHEQSQQQKVPSLNKDGSVKGYEIQRVRDWYYSQIELDTEDASRFREISEVLTDDELTEKYKDEVTAID